VNVCGYFNDHAMWVLKYKDGWPCMRCRTVSDQALSACVSPSGMPDPPQSTADIPFKVGLCVLDCGECAYR
jgi:hypothetical protein